MSDPKVLGATLAACIAFTAPTIRDLLVTRQTKKNLIKILIVDVQARNKKIHDFLMPFQLSINKAKHDAEYIPWVSYQEGLEDHIDWKNEKWLMPKSLVGDIVDFYSDTKAVIGFVNSVNSKKYKELSRDRQIAMLCALMDDLKELNQKGTRLLSLLQAQ
ncbi:hypothetical protein AABD71_17745 (plasmid) [Edwardsiella piscicida]|uniref:hypothetical protein n=1 Tax=Edwardsiella piscicida TaxID=1263550 RepID=UPI00370D685E